MRRTARLMAIVATGVLMGLPAGALADDDDDLPAGPIRERHELMENMGDQAEDINEAFNLGGGEGFDTDMIARTAGVIAMDAHKIPDLFPKGSTDPKSRALPAIWENWDQFVQMSKDLEQAAQSLSLAAASEDDEDDKEKKQKMFAACKACHDKFRKPDEKKK